MSELVMNQVHAPNERYTGPIGALDIAAMELNLHQVLRYSSSKETSPPLPPEN